jgi:hypothetical protein
MTKLWPSAGFAALAGCAWVLVGTPGLVIVTVVGAFLLLLWLRTLLSPPPRPSPRRAEAPMQTAWSYPTFRRINSQLLWGGTGRHFDRIVRPLLAETARGLLAERGLDLSRDLDEVAHVVPASLWPLIAPEGSAPAEAAISASHIDDLLDQLEAL